MHYDILGVAVARCKADANIASLVGTKVYNNVPKGTVRPYLKVSWGDAVGLPDKTTGSLFTEGTLTFDYWDESFGDKNALIMIDYLTDEFHMSTLALTLGSTNLLMTRSNYNTFLESDGVAFHGVINFKLLIED